MSEPASNLGPCDAKDCDLPATQALVTNYGFVGNVCDKHYDEISELLSLPLPSAD